MDITLDTVIAFINSHQQLLVASVMCFLIGALLIHLLRASKIKQLNDANNELSLTLKLERQNRAELDDILEATRAQLANTFNQLSNEALDRNNNQFLKLAEENLKRYQSEAKAELSSKEKSIEQLVKPINDALKKTNEQIHNIEKERKEAYGSLRNTIDQMNQSQQNLQQETQNLVQALRRPEVRGQWGEMTLKRLAELSGMVEHCDFFDGCRTDQR